MKNLINCFPIHPEKAGRPRLRIDGLKIVVMTPGLHKGGCYTHGHKFYKNSLSDEQKDIMRARRKIHTTRPR